SSIVSAATTAPAEKERIGQVDLSPPRGTTDSRPSTAGAVLERTPSTINHGSGASPRRRNSIPALLQANEASAGPAEPSPTKTPKRWSFFGLDSFNLNQHPRSRADSSSSAETARKEGEKTRGPTECALGSEVMQSPSGSP